LLHFTDTWAYVWTENLSGVNTYLQRENNWTSNYANCTGSWPKIVAITGKQATRLKSNPETHLDRWCTIMGFCIKL